MQFTQASVNKWKAPAGKADAIEWCEDMPGFGIRARDGGAPVYIVQYKLGSQHRRMSLGKVSKVSLDDARKLAKKTFAGVADGVDKATERHESKAAASDTFGKMIPAFLAWLKAKRSDSYCKAVE